MSPSDGGAQSTLPLRVPLRRATLAYKGERTSGFAIAASLRSRCTPGGEMNGAPGLQRVSETPGMLLSVIRGESNPRLRGPANHPRIFLGLAWRILVCGLAGYYGNSPRWDVRADLVRFQGCHPPPPLDTFVKNGAGHQATIMIIASPSGHPPTLHLSYLFVLCIRRRRRTDIRR